MELIILQEGSERKVEAVRKGSTWQIHLDGRIFQVDSARLKGDSRSFIIDGCHSVVSVRVIERTEFVVESSQRCDRVEVLEPLDYAARQATPQNTGRGTDLVTAYMPGRVAAILVEAGQSVLTGEGLVVLEAMKMENEIKAGHDGIIGEIFVAVGDAVEGGDRLVEVK